MDTSASVDELFHGMQWDDLVDFSNRAVETATEEKAPKIQIFDIDPHKGVPLIKDEMGERIIPTQTHIDQSGTTVATLAHVQSLQNGMPGVNLAGDYAGPPTKRGRHADAAVPIAIDVSHDDAGCVHYSESMTAEAPHSIAAVAPTSSYVPLAPAACASKPAFVHPESIAIVNNTAPYNSASYHAAEYDSEESSITEGGLVYSNGSQMKADPSDAGAEADAALLDGGKPKKRSRTSNNRLVWTAEMDKVLAEGVAKYKKDGGWSKIADHVGGDVSWGQCQHRWSQYLNEAMQDNINTAAWTEEEERQLEELVPQHVIKPHWNKLQNAMTQERTDWAAIGKVLNRISANCKAKYNRMQASKLRKGSFTAEENALIRQRVAQWGDKGQGLWTSLQQEMGRPASVIRSVWNLKLKFKTDGV